ncbi:serine/threonine-protein kinase [Chondromyces apiculatus]|uniref:non-specific serine/threonine protein kinase n=1 Tax=Chondromyces apiculatus DSM 436 TaxID=1192034 RepID=A0A017TIQ8_9BACT|nr:serine/threonine-protein kinase [Chondromyces apiculatus]EYF08735.1 Hypothetical protein CAP_2596 [Chondromyces apiculatus DSM 436]
MSARPSGPFTGSAMVSAGSPGYAGDTMRQGTVIAGKYRLQHLLGDGAAGEVWSAINARTEREVAIKLITGADPELRERAVREAQILGRVSHRNVVEVLDAGETERGEPFLVMPRLFGETLAERLKREGRLAPAKAAAVALEVARGLAAAHALGVIHRDLKPSNIFLHRDPETGEDLVRVLDFGVGKLLGGHGPKMTREGEIVGSPAYMSPEQARADERLDHHTDVWSLGVVLFEMLAGRRPFTSRSIAVITEIVGAPIPSVDTMVPGLPPELTLVVSRCLVRDVTQRVQTAQELVTMLRACAGGEVSRPSSDLRRSSSEHALEAPVSGTAATLLPGAVDEDQIPTMAQGQAAGSEEAPGSQGNGFRPVPTTLLDSSRPSQLWRDAMAVARAHAEAGGAGNAGTEAARAAQAQAAQAQAAQAQAAQAQAAQAQAAQAHAQAAHAAWRAQNASPPQAVHASQVAPSSRDAQAHASPGNQPVHPSMLSAPIAPRPASTSSSIDGHPAAQQHRAGQPPPSSRDREPSSTPSSTDGYPAVPQQLSGQPGAVGARMTGPPSSGHLPLPPAREPGRLGTGMLVLLGAGSLLTVAVVVAIVIGIGHHLAAGRSGGAVAPPADVGTEVPK